MPFAFLSSHTKSPKLAGRKKPKSTVRFELALAAVSGCGPASASLVGSELLASVTALLSTIGTTVPVTLGAVLSEPLSSLSMSLSGSGVAVPSYGPVAAPF